MRYILSLLLISLFVLCGFAQADTTVQTGDLDVVGGHFELPQYGGFRNSDYIDVQTRSTSYAYWGLARWNLSGVKTDLDSVYGVGNWEITNLTLEMYRTQYDYSHTGYVLVRYTHDDDSNYLQFANLTDGASDPVGGQLVNDPCDTNGTYVKTILYIDEGDNYVPLQYELYDDVNDPTPNAGQLMMLEDIRADDSITLCFVDDPLDFSVSAAWAGPGTSHSGQQPRLYITAKESGTHVPSCSDKPQMDFNDDCVVNFVDFAEFCGGWLDCGFADPNDCP